MPSAMVKVPTALESTLMSAILEHHDGPLTVDWEGVAQAMGYKNGQVASDRFRQVKKKLGWGSGVRVNKGTNPSKSNIARAPAKARAPASKKPAAEKAAPATKKSAAAKKLPKYFERYINEKGSSEVENDRLRDLMAASDSEDDQQKKFMQDKVGRSDFNTASPMMESSQPAQSK